MHERNNKRSWINFGMAYFHCHKDGHLAKDYKYRGKAPLEEQPSEAAQVNFDEIRDQMNKTWRRKSQDDGNELGTIDGTSSSGLGTPIFT